jgi:2-keto-4-pentenoate hydratase/2-oxohepta-3-ene-1,7-dioic acid hydratase in catechol pathway
MRLVTFTQGGQPRLGVQVVRDGNNYVLDLARVRPDIPAGMVEFLNAGERAWAAAGDAAATAGGPSLLPAAQVTLLAPIARPGKILCLGYNYVDHLGKGQTEPPPFPTFFCKTVNTIIGPEQAIIVPRITAQVDYEAELALVIGKRCRHVTEEQALAVVAGYTIFNDVSARDYQNRTSQWLIGKSFDTFGPMGPALVSADEIADPQQLELWLTLNGQEMQRTNTRNMIFSIRRQIAELSDAMTLEPGDIISTGTPAKTALARSLPPFMKPGDRVVIHIEKIGELANPLVAEA